MSSLYSLALSQFSDVPILYRKLSDYNWDALLFFVMRQIHTPKLNHTKRMLLAKRKIIKTEKKTPKTTKARLHCWRDWFVFVKDKLSCKAEYAQTRKTRKNNTTQITES